MIHRDLAVRNILVADDYTMKIADFGMAKDISDEGEYITDGKGVAPIRWMSPEALFYKTFSTKSDV